MPEPIDHRELICNLSFGNRNGKPCLWIHLNHSAMNYGEFILCNAEDFGILFQKECQRYLNAGYKIRFIE